MRHGEKFKTQITASGSALVSEAMRRPLAGNWLLHGRRRHVIFRNLSQYLKHGNKIHLHVLELFLGFLGLLKVHLKPCTRARTLTQALTTRSSCWASSLPSRSAPCCRQMFIRRTRPCRPQHSLDETTRRTQFTRVLLRRHLTDTNV